MQHIFEGDTMGANQTKPTFWFMLKDFKRRFTDDYKIKMKPQKFHSFCEMNDQAFVPACMVKGHLMLKLFIKFETKWQSLTREAILISFLILSPGSACIRASLLCSSPVFCIIRKSFFSLSQTHKVFWEALRFFPNMKNFIFFYQTSLQSVSSLLLQAISSESV